MKNYIRKGLSTVLIAAALVSSIPSYTYAMPRIIDQTVETQNVTSGVTLYKYNRFTISGWQKTNVLTVDLNNENVKVDTLQSKNSVVELDTVKKLAQSHNAVAAINGGFFDWGSGKTGYAYGPIISSSEISLAAYRNNTDLATFSIDNMNNALFSYWNTQVQLITPNGTKLFAGSYNRYSKTYTDITIVDRKFGAKSLGVSTQYPDWFEAVVVDGVLTELRDAQPAVDIPENGFVLMTRAAGKQIILDNFKIGDPVNYEISINADVSNMKMALTGGSLLVQEGNIVSSFTHLPDSQYSRAPRTAIGSSKDGKKLYVVTVDGRSSKSIGMSQYELAEYMQSIGCYYAINMDGGGSTTMVARPEGINSLVTVNSPSDGYERSVATGLGIFSIAPQGPLDSIIVEAYEDKGFVNMARAFTIKGVDKYLNPVSVSLDDVKWSVSGVSGRFESNVFYPTSSGTATITATIGNATGSTTFEVLSAPVKLELNHSNVYTSAGKSTTFTVTGYDKNGFSASIAPGSVKWTTKTLSGNSIGSLKSNVFTASNAHGSIGYVGATVGNVSAYSPIYILDSNLSKVIENFDTNGIKAQASDKKVTAKYTQAKNRYKSGKYSGKLEYNFNTVTKSNKVAYLNFANGGIPIESATSRIGFWVYSDSKKPVSISAMVSDSSGKLHYKTLVTSVSWTGWKHLNVSVADIKSPTKLLKLYVSLPGDKKSSGSLYFDDVSITYSGYNTIDSSKLPKNTVPKDDNYKDMSLPVAATNFSFSVFGQSKAYTENDKEQINKLSTLAKRINTYLEASVVVGSQDSLSKSLSVPKLGTGGSNYSYDKNGNKIIVLDTRKGGLRSSNSEQWFWLKDQLSSFTGNNLFVCLSGGTQSFTDSQEGKLLETTLEQYKKDSGKNVWVFYNGSTDSSYMRNGVKYITTKGFDNGSPTFVTVRAKGNEIYYQFKTF